MSAFISAVRDLIVLASGSRLLAIRVQRNSAFKCELCVPENGKKKDDNAEGQTSSSNVTSIYVSSCQSYILATTSDKRFVVWSRQCEESCTDESNEKWVLHSVRDTPRKGIQTTLTDQVPPMALVADRAGDVHEYPLDFPEAAPQLLLGRLSMLLDMKLTSNNDLLIVCDRDEKIQVSHYPECYDIVSFCLGHQQFVTSIATLDHYQHRLVSVGGDGQLKLWNILTGQCLASFDCWTEASKEKHLQPFEQFSSTKDGKCIRPSLKKVLSNGNLVVAVYSRVPYVHILRCDGESLSSRRGLYTTDPVWSAALDENSTLWILTPLLSVYQLDAQGHHSKIQPNANIAKFCDEIVIPLKGTEEVDSGLDILYKQWFDNVEDYLQRKKTREEGKQMKKRRAQDLKVGSQ